LPDENNILSRLEKCIRQGDWDAVARLTGRIGDDPPFVTADAMGERLRDLRRALVAARIARGGLAVSLARVRAAARFTHSRALPARQEFGGPAVS